MEGGSESRMQTAHQTSQTHETQRRRASLFAFPCFPPPIAFLLGISSINDNFNIMVNKVKIKQIKNNNNTLLIQLRVNIENTEFNLLKIKLP